MTGFFRRLRCLNRRRRFLEDCARPDDLARLYPLPRILSSISIPLRIGRSFIEARVHPIAQDSQYCGNDEKHCGKGPQKQPHKSSDRAQVMEIFSLQDIGVEIGLAEGGQDKAGEAQAEPAYQYHAPSYSMPYEMHDSSENRAQDDHDAVLCKYPYALNC